MTQETTPQLRLTPVNGMSSSVQDSTTPSPAQSSWAVLKHPNPSVTVHILPVCSQTTATQLLHHQVLVNNPRGCVRLVLKEGANPNQMLQSGPFSECAMHVAARFGRVAVLRALTRFCRGDPNIKAPSTRQTPLHYAAANSPNAEVIDCLVQLGASVFHRDGCGFAPLHVAAARGSVRVIGRLLRFGAFVDQAAGDRATPLHVASRAGKTEAMMALVEGGASFGLRDDAGCTALMAAVEGGECAAVALLAGRGADVNVVNMFGQTPLLIAMTKNDNFMALLLVRLGARAQTDSDFSG